MPETQVEIERLLKETLPAELRRRLEIAGEEAARLGSDCYVVGGFVRDLLRGVPNLDLDLLVERSASDLAAAVARRLGGTARHQRRFATASLRLPDGSVIDFATCRSETYPSPGALPVVHPGTLIEDLRRRDFTVNAMAIAITPNRWGELVDPFGGRRDLERREMAVLHSGSFLDDPTRILRRIRFEIRFGWKSKAQTRCLAGGAVAAGALDTISPERLRREFMAILYHRSRAGAGVRRLRELGVLEWFAPGIVPPEQLLRALPVSIRWWQKLGQEDALEVDHLTLAVVLSDLSPAQAAAICVCRLRFSPGESEAMDDLVRLAREGLYLTATAWPSEITRALTPLRPEGWVLLHALLRRAGSRRADCLRLSRFVRDWRHRRLLISGDDLKALGHPAGKALGRALRATLTAHLDGMAATRKDQIEFAVHWLNEHREEH